MLKHTLLVWCLTLALAAIASAGVAKDENHPDGVKSLLVTLAQQEKKFGANHPKVVLTLIKIFEIYEARREYTKAESVFKRILAIFEKSPGKNDSTVADSLSILADLYVTQGHYAQAEPLYKRSLALSEKALGPEHLRVALSQYDLAKLYQTQGLYAQAESLYKQALAIREKKLGPNHPDVASILNNLASLSQTQGNYAQAEQIHKRALAIYESANGSEHPYVATTLNNLATLYQTQGLYAKAEPLYKRALALDEKALGPEHRKVAMTLNNLAELHGIQGNFTQAEKLHKRALGIREKVLGIEHPDIAMSLNNLAALYISMGIYDQAETLLKRALEIYEEALGPGHPDVALILNNLASLSQTQGYNAQAESLYKRSLAICEIKFGSEHPDVARILNNLADLYRIQGNFAQAELLNKRSLAIYETAFGAEHSTVAMSLNNLAVLYETQGLYAQAEPLYKRALQLNEKAYGPSHPAVATSLNNLAGIYALQNQPVQALEYSRTATSNYRRRLPVRSDLQLETEGFKDKSWIRFHLDILAKVSGTVAKPNQAAEGFDLIQLIHGSDTAASVAQSAARNVAPNTKLAETVRRQQDAIQRYRFLDSQLIKSVSEPPKNRRMEYEANLHTEISRLGVEIAAVEKLIAVQFPEYAALVSIEPVPLTEVQALLQEGEALIAFVSNAERTHMAIVRRETAVLLDSPIGHKELDALVRRIRYTLEDNPLTTPYDVDAAHAIYLKLVAPLLPHLDGVRNLLVVADGPMSSLPLGVLLEAPSTVERPELKDYQNLSWLAKRYSFTTLPAVISLKALRKHGKPTASGQQPFLGMGNPVLEGDGGGPRGGKAPTLAEMFLLRGDVANVDALRKLSALPDTADELQAIAKALGADTASTYLQENATETNAKRLPLDHYRVLAFATHSLVAGETKNIVEPGLVLTPPAKATPEDDGFLAASEVAQLNLNADWVVLSACNTAAPDGTPGAAGLTGLAKSFFYAGARALLVSHWPVISSATTRLITDTFKLQADNPSLGKSGALRQAMLNMINDDEIPEYAHPAFWAPFVVVGDGR